MGWAASLRTAHAGDGRGSLLPSRSPNGKVTDGKVTDGFPAVTADRGEARQRSLRCGAGERAAVLLGLLCCCVVLSF